MLNQVYVFGYFHADLPPGQPVRSAGRRDRLLSTSGSSASCRTSVRDSLTRYSWLLFRGEVESAVPGADALAGTGPETDVATTRWQLIRVHQAFLYDTVADRQRTTDGGTGPRPARREPYSKLAVDILGHDPHAAADDVAEHRRLPEDAGHARPRCRHSLAVDLRPAGSTSAFVRAPGAPAGARPRSTRADFDRCTQGTGRVQRALQFMEFIEAQEPVITEATSMLFGYRNRIRRVKRG
jgi:hypothetical protein